MKVALKRWELAQKFEYRDWATHGKQIADEFEEAQRKYQGVLAKIEKKYGFQNDWQILDLGCGPTLVGRLFRKGELTGVDPLADKLEVQKLYPGAKIVEGRGEELPFGDSSFDTVFCRNVIDHTQSPLAVVAEARRVLKRGGIFLLASYTYNPFIKLMKLLAEKVGIERSVYHPYVFTPKGLKGLVKGKFTVLEEKEVYKGMGPHDYGKVGGRTTHWSVLYDWVLFLNFKVLGFDWFLKEILLVCRKEE